MRIVSFKSLLSAAAVLLTVAPLHACGCLDVIKFPGLARAAVLRGEHLLCLNDANHIIVVDLKKQKAFDLGPAENRRWNGDVLYAQALLLAHDRLEVIALDSGKTVQTAHAGNDPVRAFGFAGKG